VANQEIFTALADPTRRCIFEALREHPMSVGEIAAEQPVSRPAVSQHLKVLVDAKLVSAKAEGTKRFYSIRREGLLALREYLDSFWSDALSAYSAEVAKQMRTN